MTEQIIHYSQEHTTKILEKDPYLEIMAGLWERAFGCKVEVTVIDGHLVVKKKEKDA